MTAEFHKAMKPDRVLVVDHGQWPQDFAQYANAPDGRWITKLNLSDLSLDAGICRDFLDGLDTVYCVETFYDNRFRSWCDDAGVRSVMHGMPELTGPNPNQNPHEWWWPTDWLLDELPAGRVVSVPIPAPPPNISPAPPDTEPLRVLHVAGRRAIGDRNGTTEFVDALRRLREPVHATIITQESQITSMLQGIPSNVTVDLVTGGVANRWQMYDQQHIMCLPRRYGGLSLPVLEALAVGVVPMLPMIAPNYTWPALYFDVPSMSTQRCPHGVVPSADISSRWLAGEIDRAASRRSWLIERQREVAAFALAFSWATLRGNYEAWLS
jgi:hypothetical protein